MTDEERQPTPVVGSLIVAAATINLPGLPCGVRAWVDPANPRITCLLAAGYLMPESGDAGT